MEYGPKFIAHLHFKKLVKTQVHEGLFGKKYRCSIGETKTVTIFFLLYFYIEKGQPDDFCKDMLKDVIKYLQRSRQQRGS